MKTNNNNKMKRTILLLMTLHFGLTGLNAQGDYNLQVKGDASSMKIEVANLFAGLRFEGHNSDQIEIDANGYRGLPEKAKGLKPLSAYGEDNTGIGLYVEQQGNTIQISGVSRASRDADYTIKIPENMKLKIDSEDWNADDIEVRGTKNEVEIKANSAGLILTDVTGPLVLNSINGEMEVAFTNLNQQSPSSISATNGDIDISMPANSKADFSLSCLNGEVYTDLDIKFDEEDRNKMRRVGGGIKTDALLGVGGVEFSIRAINGNIYLRKQ